MSYRALKGLFSNSARAPEDHQAILFRLTSEDGTQTSDGYFRIPKPKISGLLDIGKRLGNDNIDILEIDYFVLFEVGISEDTFCGEIYLVDANGDLSEPQEICVLVNAWGGNDNLIGSWVQEKRVITYGFEGFVIEYTEQLVLTC